MTWTPDKPVAPGHYWHRRVPEDEAYIVCIAEAPKPWPPGLYLGVEDGNLRPLKNVRGGEWAGPIPEPSEPDV